MKEDSGSSLNEPANTKKAPKDGGPVEGIKADERAEEVDEAGEARKSEEKKSEEKKTDVAEKN